MRLLFLIYALLFCADVYSQVRLVIPIATTHIEYSNEKYNNDNRGIGVEYLHNNKHILGVLYLRNDSYSNENVYFYYGRKYQLDKDVSFSFSGFFATSYDAKIITPLVSVSYYCLRIMTTFPFGRAFNQNSDMVNFQIVFPVKF